jgi:hypothetical protein
MKYHHSFPHNLGNISRAATAPQAREWWSQDFGGKAAAKMADAKERQLAHKATGDEAAAALSAIGALHRASVRHDRPMAELRWAVLG